ncbi:uncharacterized protein [Littorina saxatilis]|uniref:uncharacterized protein isoform X2 n=2 Tax=Littorina saxatilis TaxID=31220 RepID=UPI0038B50040
MAPRTFHVLLTCLLCLLQTGCCQTIDGPTQITITPPTLSLAPNVSDATGGQVTVQCRASSLGQGEDLLAMNIQRLLDNDPNAVRTVVVGARSSQDQGNAALIQTLQGATVSGSIGDASITLTMSMAKCADAGIYYCTATALDSNTKTKYYESFKNVTIKVSPGTITLTPTPSGINSWKVNETLTILCNGVVGTVVNENNIEWVWQYQQIDPNFPSGFENWQDYSIIGDPTTDIVTGSLGASTSNCYKRQSSTLTRYLTLEDTNRQYRCYVNNRDVTSQGVDHAQMVDVGTVTESGVAPITPGPSTSVTTTTVSTGTDKSKDDRLKTCDCPDVGVIIGAVVAVLIIIDVVILAVVIIVLKGRMNDITVGPATQTVSEETRGKDNQMSSLDNVNRPVKQRPVEQRGQRPIAAAGSNPGRDGHGSTLCADSGTVSIFHPRVTVKEIKRLTTESGRVSIWVLHDPRKPTRYTWNCVLHGVNRAHKPANSFVNRS